MKKFNMFLPPVFWSCVAAVLVCGHPAIAQNTAALKATSDVANRGGVKIVADFYASSKLENAAISPPSQFAAFAALAHISKGQTQEDLYQLLSLTGKETMAFGKLDDYLSKVHSEGQDYSDEQDYSSGGHYKSLGYLLARTGDYDPNRVPRNELLEKYGTPFKGTDFSDAEVEKINDEISKMTNEWFHDVVKPSSDTTFMVCTAANLREGWGWSMSAENTNGTENLQTFKFDGGARKIPFLSGNAKEHHTVIVNNKPGWRFPLGVSDLTIVKCQNGADLRRLAKAIASDGLQIQVGRKVSQRTTLHIPGVAFKTKFNVREHAKAKGWDSPFIFGKAEFTIVPEHMQNMLYCRKAETESMFEVGMDGISLVQVTVIEVAPGAPNIPRDQRLPNNIIIDSPYLMILTERTLGTVLSMAFIANPGYDTYEPADFDSDSDTDDSFTGASPVGSGQSPTSGYQPQSSNRGVRIAKIYPNTTASTLTHSSGRNLRLETGDYLASINGQPIQSDADFKKIVAGLPRNSDVSVEVIDRRTSQREVFHGRMDVSSSLRFGLSLAE